MSATLAYLKALYGDADLPGMLVGCIKAKTRDGRSYLKPQIWTDTPEAFARWSAQMAPHVDVYAGVALQDRSRALAWKQEQLDAARSAWEQAGSPSEKRRDWQASESNSRGSNHTAAALPAVAIDIDLARPGAHAAQNLPASFEQVREAWSAVFPFEATAWISSGYGLYAVLAFRELWTFDPFDSCQERARAAALLSGVQQLLREEWGRRGWHLDNTADLTRVLRVVGSLNHKLGEPRPVEIVGGSRVRFNPSDLEDLVPSEMLTAARQTNATRRRDRVEGRPADSGPIVSGCAWMRHVYEDRATLDEPTWYGALSVLGRCEEGATLAHSWSEGHPGYSPEETSAKLEQALRASGPVRCSRVRRQLGGERFCSGCPAWGTAASPISLGYMTEARLAVSRAGVSSMVERFRAAVEAPR